MRPEDALKRLPVPVRRAAYRVAHALLQVWWLVRRPHTQGVKCILRHEGRMLFVRHTYGDRTSWEFPGGGIARGETPALAAAREAREELGVAADWREVAVIHARGGRRPATLTIFAADLRGPRGAGPAGGDQVSPVALTVDAGEIAEVRWARPDDPPRPLSPLSRSILRRAARAA